jgi:hypothetical protein
MELLIIQFFPTSCHFIPLSSKYSPQHPVNDSTSRDKYGVSLSSVFTQYQLLFYLFHFLQDTFGDECTRIRDSRVTIRPCEMTHKNLKENFASLDIPTNSIPVCTVTIVTLRIFCTLNAERENVATLTLFYRRLTANHEIGEMLLRCVKTI